ncbi:hypothetical protein DFH11DRAFT_1129252 [Phellopilus nigrolimitatus]|nr:hypothetical protein DFH11DRAFT_1129252 [Phellopilus nigrolimitatus]
MYVLHPPRWSWGSCFPSALGGSASLPETHAPRLPVSIPAPRAREWGARRVGLGLAAGDARLYRILHTVYRILYTVYCILFTADTRSGKAATSLVYIHGVRPARETRRRVNAARCPRCGAAASPRAEADINLGLVGMVWYGMVWYGMVCANTVHGTFLTSSSSPAKRKSFRPWGTARSRRPQRCAHAWPPRAADSPETDAGIRASIEPKYARAARPQPARAPSRPRCACARAGAPLVTD